MEKPGFSGDGAYADKISRNQIVIKTCPGSFKDINGRDITKENSTFELGRMILFRTFFNPVDYTGEFFQDMRKQWHTNELGFIIGSSFVLGLMWQL